MMVHQLFNLIYLIELVLTLDQLRVSNAHAHTKGLPAPNGERQKRVLQRSEYKNAT